jgi:hypothetical protein
VKINLTNLPEFQHALRTYQEATGKDGVTILNRTGRNVAFRAAAFTPKATAARIRSDLSKDPHLVYALTSLALRKQGIGIVPKPGFRQEVQKFIARRVASIGFLRAGWAPAIEALGGSFRGRKMGVHGWASKATISRLITEIANTVPGIDKEGVFALISAVDYVAADMLEYAENLLAKTAREHSP